MLLMDPKYKIVDAHRHLLDRGVHAWINNVQVLWNGHSLSTMEANTRAAGVSLVVPVEADGRERENDFLIEQASRSELIQRCVGWLPLDASDIAQQVADLPEEICGIRVVRDQSGKGYYDSAPHQRGINAILDGGKTFDVLLESDHQEMIRTLLPAIGGGDHCSRIMFDHFAFKERVGPGGPSTEWRERVDWCANFGNKQAHVKCSAWFPEGIDGFRAEWTFPYFRQLLKSFGANRMVWGSDDPIQTSPVPVKWSSSAGVLRPTASYEDMLNIIFAWFLADEVGVEDQAKIMGKNAARFYGLSL